MPQPEAEAPRRWTAGAVAILVIGLLILVPSGLCTAFMGIAALAALFASPAQWSETLGMLWSALVVGVPFLLLGGGLVWIARRLRRTG